MAPENVTALATIPADRRLAPRDAFDWSPEQLKIIRDSCAPGAQEWEFAALIEVARAKRLNPLTRQIHFVKRSVKVGERYEERWTFQTSIDGFRAIAQRTSQYDGQDEPDFIYDEQKRLICCKVKVYRKGISRPFVGIAHWNEYVQLTRDNNPTRMWADKPHVMLAKCAEAQAHRKAFPDDDQLGGLYVPEEMGEERDEAPLVIDAARKPEPAPLPAKRPIEHVPVQQPAERAPEHAPLKQAPKPTEEPMRKPEPEIVETIADLMKRWQAALFTAQTLAECDKLAREIGKRLQPNTPEHDQALALYKARKQELKTRHMRPTNGAPEREPGGEG